MRFFRTEAGNYLIWDNGGRVGQRGLPYVQCGEIIRQNGGWELRRDGRQPVAVGANITAAKNLYMVERAIPINPLEYVPQTEPTSYVTVAIGMGEWELLDEWRSRIFSALIRRNGAASITLMLSPIDVDYHQRQYTLRLPVPVAEDLDYWRNRW